MALRKHWLRQPLSWQRGGAVALVVLGVVVAAALVLDSDTEPDLEPVVARLREHGQPPVDVVVRAARAGRIVLLSDIHGRAGPKRLAAAAIRALARGPGLDAVVLEVPSSEQPYIDAYLNAEDEDASALLARPAAVRAADGTARDYLEIYRAVRALNEERGPARRIGIVAADVDDWPPPDGASPEAVARAYHGRAAHMLQRLDDEVFSITPEARVLVFMDGYLTLRGSRGELRFAGGEPVRVRWLGELLRERSGPDARTVLLDPGTMPGAMQTLPGYHGTTLHRPLRRGLDHDAGTRIDAAFAALPDPVPGLSSPGLRLVILPAGYVLPDVADAYVFLTGGR